MRPECQVVDCDTEATELLRSRKNGMELHLCSECAGAYHSEGWTKIRGTVELQ